MTKGMAGLGKIDRAAVRIIGRKGFAQATTQEIAKAAGVSEGLIFRYYKTKLDLGKALFRKHYQEVLTRLTAVGAAQTDTLERIRAVAKDLYRWFDENRDVAAFLIKTHQEFMEGVDQSQGFLTLAGVGLKSVLGEALFLLFPSDILSAMIVGAFLQVIVECIHGQVKGPLGPRMEAIIDAAVSLAARASPAAKAGQADPGSPAPPKI